MTRKQLKRRIRECEAEIETIKTLPYYSIFNRQQEQDGDLRELYDKLKKYTAELHREGPELRKV